jgi:hypothetical protein
MQTVAPVMAWIDQQRNRGHERQRQTSPQRNARAPYLTIPRTSPIPRAQPPTLPKRCCPPILLRGSPFIRLQSHRVGSGASEAVS